MLRGLHGRPRTGNSKVALVLLAVLFAIFCLPLFQCPCEGRMKTVPLSEPTEDRFEFKRVGCRRCEGSGRIPMVDHGRVVLESQ